MIALDYEPLRRRQFRIPGWFSRGLFLMIGAAALPLLPWELQKPVPPPPAASGSRFCVFDPNPSPILPAPTRRP